MTTVAAIAYLAGLAFAFGLRSWLHLRRTGRTGFNGVSGTPGSAAWWGGIAFVVAVLAGTTAAVGALAGWPATLWAAPGAVELAGTALVVVGVLGTLAAQSGMGSSWRIGVDESERTDLVTSGVFAVVRNPIFTAMVTAQAGFTLAAPTWLSVAALACLVAAVEVQVRVIEEPYLVRTHGEAYVRYTGRTGRFLPRIGRRVVPVG